MVASLLDPDTPVVAQLREGLQSIHQDDRGLRPKLFSPVDGRLPGQKSSAPARSPKPLGLGLLGFGGEERRQTAGRTKREVRFFGEGRSDADQEMLPEYNTGVARVTSAGSITFPSQPSSSESNRVRPRRALAMT